MKYEATTPEREDLANLVAFAVIAEEASFTRAASRLGVSRSALSHSLRTLEERLGVVLLQRTTRSVSTTQAGQALADRLKPAFDDIASAVADLGDFRAGPSGRVRISTHREAAAHIVIPKLPTLKTLYPDIVVELAIEDALTDIITTNFDAGIRPGERVAKDMISIPVGAAQRFVVVASPAYFNGRNLPRTPDDLRGHHCIVYRNVTSGRYYRWKFAKKNRSFYADIEPSFVINDAGLLVHAALTDQGLAYVLERQVRSHLDSGDLVAVLEDWSVWTAGDFLYYPSDRQMSPALRAVVDTLRSAPE